MSEYLLGDEIKRLLDSRELYIRPLLEERQIGTLSVDFRLGTEFLVSFQGRQPYINASHTDKGKGKPSSFFQETRRQLGDTFLLHPHQTVLASSLEYIKLPDNILAQLTMRSTYSRMGLQLSSNVQPGYSGCLSIELTNHGTNVVNLTVGAPLIQASFVRITQRVNYFDHPRKYICQVRPQVSECVSDEDLVYLQRIRDSHHGV